MPPDSTFIFRHALTREVVYDSILTDRKKELHEAVGQALEMLHQERLDDYYGLLSEHFIKSENFGKGAEYSKKAARRAEKAASLDNAIAYAGKRVSCLERLPQSDELEKQRIDARVALGLYLVQMNHHFQAKEVIDPIMDSAVRYDYKRRLGQIYCILGSYYSYVEEDQSEAIRVLKEAANLAEETQDIVTYFFGGFWLGIASGYNCEFEKSMHYFQGVIDINVAVNNLWGIAATKGNLAFMCSALWGKSNLGFQISKEAVQLAEENGDIYSQGIAYGGHGWSCFTKGYLDQAEKYLLKSADYCERANQQAWNGATRFCLGELYSEQGNFTKSKEHFEKTVRCIEDLRINPSLANLAQLGLERLKVIYNGRNIDLKTVFAYSKNNRLKALEGCFKNWTSEILRQMDDRGLLEAEAWITRAIEADKLNGTNWLLAKDYLSYADLLTKKGDRQKAQGNLGKAIETFKECGADGWVEKAERKLAEIAWQ